MQLPTRPFSTITPKPLDWLWRPRIPKGKITLLTGDPGSGKTTLLLNLAALLSQGKSLPPSPGIAIPGPTPNPSPQIENQNPKIQNPLPTLLLSADDNAHDTLRPKLDRLAANLAHIHLLENLHSLIPNPHHKLDNPLDSLEDAIASIPNLALLIIDPITHYLGLTDHLLPSPFRPDAPSRSILHTLANLAQKYNLALILTSRLTKKTNPNLPPQTLQRTLGSLAFSTAARSLLLLSPLPTPNPNPNPNPNSEPQPTHLLLTLKSNHAQLPHPLPLTLTDAPILFHPEQPFLPELPPKKSGPDDLINQAAVHWLTQLLAHGPLPAAAIFNDGKNNAFSISALRRAKESAGIQSRKQDWSGQWFWFLPGETRPLPENNTDRELALALKVMNAPAQWDALADALGLEADDEKDTAGEVGGRGGAGGAAAEVGGLELESLAGISPLSKIEPESLAEKTPPPKKQPRSLAAKTPKPPSTPPSHPPKLRPPHAPDSLPPAPIPLN